PARGCGWPDLRRKPSPRIMRLCRRIAPLCVRTVDLASFLTKGVHSDLLSPRQPGGGAVALAPNESDVGAYKLRVPVGPDRPSGRRHCPGRSRAVAGVGALPGPFA